MARAFSPGNISCVFKVIPHTEPARMHSLGMGFTVKEGVEAIVSEYHETVVLFNGESINFPTVRAVVKRLIQNSGIAGVKVDLSSPLPLGCGFGPQRCCIARGSLRAQWTAVCKSRRRSTCDDSAYRGG